MMRQYWELKSRYQDCLLFFRLGDFYEMFFDDAEKASRILGLTLTARASGGDEKAPMCGVPFHSAQGYIAKLLKMGEKIALCEQLEDPRKTKGLVKRGVVRVLTPGTVVESDLLEERSNNYLTAVARTPAEIGLAVVDVSTGEFAVTGFSGAAAEAELRDELTRLQPAECLVAEAPGSPPVPEGLTVTKVADAPSPAEAREALLRHFHVASLAGFGCDERPALQQAAAQLLEYLRHTHQAGVTHLGHLATYERGSFVRLDPFTLDALEVVDAGRGRDAGGPTLLSTLDLTASAMGGRALRQWLLRPLRLAGDILNRLDAVEWLVEHVQDREQIRRLLSQCADLERIGARVGSQAASPRDLGGLAASLELVAHLKALLASTGAPGLLADLAAGLDDLPELKAHLRRALVDEPPLAWSDGGVIRDGYDPRVDELRALSGSGKDHLMAMQARERARTNIDSLKVQYNSVFGYYIEIVKSKAALAPPDYVRKQTVANAERFITPELKQLEGSILGAQERLAELEEELFRALRSAAGEKIEPLLATARLVASLDALSTLAEAASRFGYVRPRIDPAGVIEIIEGRHPVLERLQSTFVSNDVRLAPWQEHLIIVTGPNMAGKSTFMRQTALITLMAHAGSFVPAKEARIGVVDGIYCRIGASDRLSRGQSTFMVEMTEVAHILHHATEDSLLIFDEVGRGTSTYDGLSIAWAIVEHIAKTLGAKTLFATHYFELTAMADDYPGIRNYNVLVREWKSDLVFLYKIVPGRADRSYGVQVARLAGLPAPVIGRARELLKELERGKSAPEPQTGGAQLPLFGPLPDPVRRRLEEAELETLTPLEAMNLLHELKELLRSGSPASGFSDA